MKTNFTILGDGQKLAKPYTKGRIAGPMPPPLSNEEIINLTYACKIKGPWESTDFRLIIGRSKIDYDRDKEEMNRKKHGYSLESAVNFLEGMLLPLGRAMVATSDPIDHGGEIRYQHLTLDDSKNIVLFVTTMRHDETVRVISLRRASGEEEQIYWEFCEFGEILVKQKSGA